MNKCLRICYGTCTTYIMILFIVYIFIYHIGKVRSRLPLRKKHMPGNSVNENVSYNFVFMVVIM
jgi:hypothetical protein